MSKSEIVLYILIVLLLFLLLFHKTVGEGELSHAKEEAAFLFGLCDCVHAWIPLPMSESEATSAVGLDPGSGHAVFWPYLDYFLSHPYFRNYICSPEYWFLEQYFASKLCVKCFTNLVSVSFMLFHI